MFFTEKLERAAQTVSVFPHFTDAEGFFLLYLCVYDSILHEQHMRLHATEHSESMTTSCKAT